MRFVATAILAVLVGCTPSTTWEAPADPRPHLILTEAEEDARAGRYEVALAKFVWFHENALALQPSLRGVRLSFALSDWHELARKYPPAMDAMHQARERAADDVLSGRELRRSFQDLAALDRQLGQRVQTKDLFETLDLENPEAAQKVFDLAEPALIEQRAFELANKYIKPLEDIGRFVERYREDLRIAPDLDDPDFREIAKKSFIHSASTLVSLLSVNGRVEEAELVATAAREELHDPALEQSLVSALQGVVPEPWP